MATNNAEVAPTPNSCVVLEPSESLSFHLQPQVAPQAMLTIRNVANDRQVAFKVKTTRPLRYLVRPNQGLLGPNEAASIMVILQQKHCDELLRLEPAERQLANDKFLVQSIYVEDSFYELVKTKSTKEMADELSNMWARTDKRALSNKKLRCRFVQDGDELDRTSSPSSPLRLSPTNASPMKPAANGNEKRLSRLSDEVQEEVATPAQLSSALLQHDISKAAGTRDGSSHETIQEVAALRKKYDELVAFTVQLTAQRDVLISDLEKTRLALHKSSTDSQRVKKLSEESTGLRHRKNGGVNGSSSLDEMHAHMGKSGKDQGQTFGPLHLLVCAIIFFVIGRYY